MKTTQQWLNEKTLEYTENPIEVLKAMLSTTIDVVEQHKKDPTSFAVKSIMENCLEHHRLFLKSVTKQKVTNDGK